MTRTLCCGLTNVTMYVGADGCRVGVTKIKPSVPGCPPVVQSESGDVAYYAVEQKHSG